MREIFKPTPLLWVPLLCSAVACQSVPRSEAPESEAPALEPNTELPFRLVDQLDDAHIRSPLNTKGSTTPPEILRATSVLDLDFDSEPVPTLPGRGCRVAAAQIEPSVAGTEGNTPGRVLRYGGHRPHTCVFLIPADPSTHYRFSRAVRTIDPNIDFQLIESLAALRHPKVMNHPDDIQSVMKGKFVAMQKLLTVHHFDRPDAGTWSTSEKEIFTSPYTRSFVLLLNDAEGLIAGRTRRADFDDLTVKKLTPSAQQELELLRETDPLPGSDHGEFAKHGQLLPVGKLSEVTPPFDRNYDYREALFAPSPTSMSFRLSGLPHTARFDFSYALHKTSRRGDAVTFRVLAKTQDGQRTALFEEAVSVRAEGPGWQWHDGGVSLAKFAGTRFELILETESPENQRGYGLWGAPAIVAPTAPLAGNDAVQNNATARLQRPNVVLVAIDTLRADRLSAYGHPRDTSPHIDALAQDGVLFEHVVAASNWTSPSFASLFTGLTPSRHQVVHRARSIPIQMTTLTEVFRSAGYRTEAAMYKAYLYNMGFEQGFERWFNVPLHDVKAQRNLDRALEWLDRNSDSPFFFFLHFNDPHQPFNQPETWQTKFTEKAALARFSLNLPIVITGDNFVQGCHQCGKQLETFKPVAKELYDSEIAYIDDRLGVFFEALKSRGLYDDTIIVLVADHGEMMWEHANTFGHGGPWLHDTLTRVPLIIKPHRSAGVQSKQRVSASVQNYDLMPTVVELAGLQLGDDERNAKSLLPLMRGEAAQDLRGRPCFTENVKHYVTAVVHNQWKLSVKHAPSRKIREQLFHLKRDPLEQKNVLRQNPAIQRALERVLSEWIATNRQGHFLFFSPGKTTGPLRLEVTTSSEFRRARALFGGNGQSGVGSVLSVRVTRDTPLVFIEFDVESDTEFDIQVRRTSEESPLLSAHVEDDAISRYQVGGVNQMISRDTPAVSVFRGAPPVMKRETEQLNAQRLQALKALGYIQ